MKRSRSSHVLPAVALLVLALALLIYPSVDISAAHDPLRTAWDRALESGSYSFSADIVQTTTPLPRATNVGRQSRQDALHIEGATNLPEQSLSFTLWSEGGSVLNSSGGVQVRVDEDRALVRRGDTGTWQEANDFTGLFAPDGDFMAYLVSAKDVVAQGADARTGIRFERYTFRVDGRSFAAHMRDQIERDMAERGELPPGAELELPRAYVDMTGDGELWVGEDGLPMRQILRLQFPDNGEDQVEAEVDVAFTDFGSGVPAHPRPFLPRRLLQEVAIFAACLGCVLVFVSFRRSQTLYTALVLAVVTSMVVTPVLQGVQAAELGEPQATRAQEQEEREQERETMLALQEILSGDSESSIPSGSEALALLEADDGADWDRDGLTDIQETVLGTNPRLADAEAVRTTLSPASAVRESGLDSDDDGLTDYQEEMLGTSSHSQDTDGDTIDDGVEVAGFVFTDTFGIATLYHTDPLEMDSNDDGIDDGREWFLGAEDDGLPDDTDEDGTPDLFDRDNDGDGVPDDLDISPFQTTTPTLTFDDANPFSLVIDNLAEGEPTYVEFQLRPTDPRHLWYAFNVLDWPEDGQGQIQDGDGATFHDVDPAGSRFPNDNGDIKLLPMLEIRIAGSPDNLPPADMLQDRYGIFVQNLQEDGSEKAIYVPLQLTTEDQGGARVAFYGKMVYLPAAAWGSAQSVRLAWAVQTMVDQCAAYEDGLCTDYPEADRNRIQIVHTYYDEWYLTGLNVREDHGTQSAVIWEDPAVDTHLNSDDTLALLTYQLDYTFFSGRDLDGDGEPDITVGELYRRFNRTTNTGVSLEQRWGITNTLRVVTGTFDHQDEALYTLGVTTTKSILDGEFTPYWSSGDPITPTLLFAREERYRSTNLDVLDNGGGIAWGGAGGRQLEVDLGAVDSEGGLPVTTMAGAKWMPYCRVAGAWEPCNIEDYWAELGRRLEGAFSGESDPEVAEGLTVFFQFYYLGLYSGVTRVVQVGNSVVQTSFAIPAMSEDATLAYRVTGAVTPAVNDGATFVVERLVARLATATQNTDAIAKFFSNVVGRQSYLSVDDLNPGLLGHLRLLRRNFSAWRQGTGHWADLAVSGAALVAVASLAIGTALLIASYISGSEGLYIAGTVLVGTGLFVMQVVLPLHTAYALYLFARESQSAVSAIKSVMGQSSEVLGATKTAAVVGLVISIGLALGFFIYQMAQGGMNSIQVSMVIAQFIAQTIVAIIYFVLSYTVVGTIIVGILSFFDLIMSVIGLSEYSVAGLLAQYIYGYASIAEPGVSVADLDTMLVDPSGGMVHGARMVVTATLDTSATHSDPTDPRPFIYLPTLWTERILRSTTVNTSLDIVEETLSASRWDMRDRWNVVHDHTYAGHNMRRAEVVDTRSTVVTLQAGINVTRSVYLNVGYDMPIASCWMGIPIPPLWIPLIPICYDDSVEDGYSSDIGNSLVLDVFPTTLDEFYWWDQLGLQADRDGDGLLATAVGGNDPDDTTWDADGDGLSDYYEIERRSRGGADGGVRPSPTSSDTDGDGLCDAQEIRLGTFPQLRDSDGDGLKDGEEVFHLNCRTGEWEGGWEFGVASVITVSPGVTQTLYVTTHVSSDPLSTDDDYDGLDDKAEHTLGTNPNAWTPSPVAIYAEIDDVDGFVAPGQSVAYTATVENHIALNPGMFVLGPLTVTLPGPVGGGVATSTYNIYQEEAAFLALDLTVAGGSSSQPMTITAETVATMHDGDVATYWRWEPSQPYIDETTASASTAVNIAATVDPTASGPFAVTSVEGAGTVGFRMSDAMLPGSTLDVYTDSRPGPGLAGTPPGVACADSGQCLTTWSNVHYHECTWFNIIEYESWYQDDCWGCGASEYYVEVNGVEEWSGGGFDTFDDRRTINKSVSFCNTASIGVWEEDDGRSSCGWYNCDDHMGTTYINYYDACPAPNIIYGRPELPPGETGCYYRFQDDGDIGDVDWYLHENEWHGIYGVLLNSAAAKQGAQFAISAQGPEYMLRQRPAAASDGTDFLVLWQQSESAGSASRAIYAQRVNSDGTLPTAAVRIDIVGVQDESLPSVTWAQDDQYYVASWIENSYGSFSLLIAVLDRNGNRINTHRIPYPSISSPPTGGAQLAYNSGTGELLMVYASNQPQNGVRGRVLDIQGGAVSSVGPEITFGGEGVGQLRYPDVAYEPRYGGWMVSWVEGAGNVHYVALGAGGQILLNKVGRGPSAAHPPTANSISVPFNLTTQANACSYETAAYGYDYAQCDIAYSRNGELYLASPQLEPISPWFGTITTDTFTLVSIDADPPTSTLSSLRDGRHYAFTGTLIIGGEARESGVISSGIAGVEISVGGGPYTATNGADSWAYAWDVPAGDGPVALRTRATDLVGNVEPAPPLITVYLDRTPPNATITDNGVISGTRSGERWRLTLDGTYNDPGGLAASGVDLVEVMLSPSGNGWQTATLNGGGWTLDYLLSAIDSEGDGLTDPTGVYTVSARATDAVGNRSGLAIFVLSVDNQPPVAGVTDTGPSATVITSTLSIGGVITDPGVVAAGLQALEVSFTPVDQAPISWLPAALASSGPGVTVTTWTRAVPTDLEGSYQIDLRGTDWIGNRSDDRSPEVWQGEIDTLDPRVAITMTYRGAGAAAQTVYQGWAQDLNLTRDGFQFACPLQAVDRGFYAETWWTGPTSNTQRLHTVDPECIQNGHEVASQTLRAYDLRGEYGEDTVGPPVGYVPPAVASTVLTPSHEGVLITADPTSITVGAYALNNLHALTLTVGGSGVISSTTWPCAPVTDTVTNALWSPLWDPPGEGRYELLTVADDCNGTVQSELQPITVTVDTQPPHIGPPPTVITTAHRLSLNRVVLTGVATDSVGLEDVELAASPWEEAAFDGATYRFSWYLGDEPDNQTYTLTLRATDGASRTDQISTVVTVDLVPPAPVSMTLAYNAGAGDVGLQSLGTVRHANPTLAVTWTASSDGSGLGDYLVGWTDEPVPTLTTLDPYALAGTHQESVVEPDAFYAHIVSQDIHGNRRLQTVGPVYVDGQTTPDYVSDLDYHGWMESGCTQISADYELYHNAYSGGSLNDVQRMYLSWDDQALRMTWTGANWNSDGDLFIYLDTDGGVGGTTWAYNPYVDVTPVITLPAQGGTQLVANYVLAVEDSASASLLAWSGGWVVISPTIDTAHFQLDTGLNPVRTDLLIPWSLLGSPTSLGLVALASEEDSLRVWAAIPDKNPLNSDRVVDALAYDYLDEGFGLTQQYEHGTLGAGACPNLGQFADADLQVSLTADPPGVEVGFLQHDVASLLSPGQPLDGGTMDGEPDVQLPMDAQSVLLGDGQTVVYTLVYTNVGAVSAPGASATVSARGGIELMDGSPQVIPLDQLGDTIYITGTVNAAFDGESAEVIATIADTAHSDFEWLWVQHGVDTAPPENLEIQTPAAYANALTNTVAGFVEDPSGVPTITLEVQSVPTGTVVATISCIDPTPMDSMWNCVWNAGGAPDGAEFDLSVMASDRFGNTTSWTMPHRLTVDSTPPLLFLSLNTESAISDSLIGPDEVGLSGRVEDDRQAEAALVCASLLGEADQQCLVYAGVLSTSITIADWNGYVPVLGDGDGGWQDFEFYGLDSVGNRSLIPVTRTAQVDVVAPVVTVTTALTGALQAITYTVLAGTVGDGMVVDSLAVHAAGPDGNARWRDLDFAGGAWSYSDRFDVPGNYRLGLEMEDVAGNHRTVGPFRLAVYEADHVADLSLAHTVSSDPIVTGRTVTYTYDIQNAGPGEATTSTLTIRPPAVASLLSAPPGCSQVGSDVFCDLGDIAVGGGALLDIQFDIPLTATGYLISAASAESSKVDIDLSDNRPVELYTRVVQPITGLAAMSDGPTVLGQVTNITASMASGTGVSFDWSLGDGEAAASYGTYETGVRSAVAYIYPDVGVYTVVVTASNEVNLVTATTVVTTDIAVATPLLYEDFEHDFPPQGWLVPERLDDQEWRQTSHRQHSGSFCAFYDDLFGEQDSWLVTPQFTPTLGSELVFWQYQNYAFYYGRHSIQASLGSCDPKDGDFVELAELGPGSEDTWEEVRLGLDQFAGLPVCLAFRYEGDWDDEWYVDDIQVTVEMVLTHDGPTPLGQATTMTASIATGSNVAFDWALGEGQMGSGGVVSYTFPSAGYHTVVVTASNSVSAISATMTVPIWAYAYLPLITRAYAPTCLDDYETDDNPSLARTIATDGTPQHHTFYPAADEDWLAIEVLDPAVDHVIETFDLTGSDTVIYLFDSDGVTLLDWNDEPNPMTLASRLDFDPYHAGTFYVKVVNYDQGVAGCGIGYSVRVTAQ